MFRKSLISKSFVFFIFFVVSACLFASETTEEKPYPQYEHTAERFSCVQYLRNYDGDTITFNIHGVHPVLGERITVRIQEIDIAEMNAKSHCEKQAASKATNFINATLKNAKRVDLKDVKRDKYFRINARIFAEEVELSGELLRKKLAVIYDGGKK